MVVYKGQRKRLRHIDRMIKGQYAEYFAIDKNIGNEELIPDERGKGNKVDKEDRIRGRVDNSKPLKGLTRFQRARRAHKEEGMSDMHRDYINPRELKAERSADEWVGLAEEVICTN